MFLLDTNVISELRRPVLLATVPWLQQRAKFNRRTGFVFVKMGQTCNSRPQT
jgi:hypothetical protein